MSRQCSPSSRIRRSDRAEVIVVDDDSTDETSDVARAHGAQSPSVRVGGSARWQLGHLALPTAPPPSCSSSTPIAVWMREPSPLFCAASRDPPSELSRRAVSLTAGTSLNSLVERSASFSALMLHETKKPSGQPRLLAHRAPDGSATGRMADEATIAGRATGPSPCAQDSPVGKSSMYRKRSCTTSRSAHTPSSAPTTFARQSRKRISCGDWLEPVASRNRAVAPRAASLRRQPLNAAAWLALRTRLWSERAVGLMRPEEALARWGRLAPRPPLPSGPGPMDHASGEPSGKPA